MIKHFDPGHRWLYMASVSDYPLRDQFEDHYFLMLGVGKLGLSLVPLYEFFAIPRIIYIEQIYKLVNILMTTVLVAYFHLFAALISIMALSVYY